MVQKYCFPAIRPDQDLCWNQLVMLWSSLPYVLIKIYVGTSWLCFGAMEGDDYAFKVMAVDKS